MVYIKQFCIVVALLIVTQQYVFAQTKIGRYTNAAIAAKPAQLDPLSSVVQLVFPKQIITVGDALRYLLQRTGFSLSAIENADPNLIVLLNHPLPDVQRELGPIRIRQGLETLAGKPWALVTDPVNRLVSFELKQKYAKSFSAMANAQSAQMSNSNSVAGIFEEGSDDKASYVNGIEVVGNRHFNLNANPKDAGAPSAAKLDSKQINARQKQLLAAPVLVNLRNASMHTVLSAIMGSAWQLDLQLADARLAKAQFDFTSHSTRRKALADFLTPLGLKIDFYPAIKPQALAIVSSALPAQEKTHHD